MIRGKKRPVAEALTVEDSRSVQKINATLTTSIHNRFDIEVVDVITGKIKRRAQAENVICNQLWVRLFSPASYFGTIHYGTGAGSPASTDTQLFSFLGYKVPLDEDDMYTPDWENGSLGFRRKIMLSETEAVGSLLTEVGIAYSTTPTSLCTHAMLQDMNGNQISILKTNTDIINIYATVFVHWNTAGYESPDGSTCYIVPFIGSNYVVSTDRGAILSYLCGIYTSSSYENYASPPKSAMFKKGVLYRSSKNQEPDFLASASVSTAFDVDTKTMTHTLSRVGVGANNTGGLLWALFFSWPFPSDYARGFSYALRLGGTSITNESIGTGDGETVRFNTKFPYPTLARVFVNGVEETNVTVYKQPNIRQFDGFMERLLPDTTAEQHLYAHDTDGTSILYNPNYEIGTKSFLITAYASTGRKISIDGVSWVTIMPTGNTFTVPSEYKHFKYISPVTPVLNRNFYEGFQLTPPDNWSEKTILFDNPPPPGAIITANYYTPCIAKDANHVFDLTMTIQLGEYTA